MTRRFKSLLGPGIALLIVPVLAVLPALLMPASAESVVGRVGRVGLEQVRPSVE